MENSATRARTCEGPITMPMAKATAVAIPNCLRTLSRCTEIPDTTNARTVSMAAINKNSWLVALGRSSDALGDSTVTGWGGCFVLPGINSA
ncbi:hypothetical protein D9M73_218320 [compost metagenome]